MALLLINVGRFHEEILEIDDRETEVIVDHPTYGPILWEELRRLDIESEEQIECL